MPDDATGVDVKAVVAIAIRLGVPLGFEEAGALAERVRGPFRPLARQQPLVSWRPTPLDVRGATLRQALDAVVVKDRRYAWQTLDGVVVIRPVAAWRHAAHPLLRSVGALQLEGAPPLAAGSPGDTLLDRLNCTVRAHGGFHWILSSGSSLVLLDRGQAVEVVEPVLRVGDRAAEESIHLGWR